MRSNFFVLALLTAPRLCWAQPPQPLDPGSLRLHNVAAAAATHKGVKAVKITEPPGQSNDKEDKLAIIPGTENFSDGVIQVELAGQPGAGAATAARGFTGVAFRIAADVSRFDCFYLRPTNGRAEDQVRRNHSAQYVAFPEFPWHRLRKEFPEKYESYVDLVPGEWTKVRIEVRGDSARLYVHGNAQPTLIVSPLKSGLARGSVGLWIGPGTEAHFANLRIEK